MLAALLLHGGALAILGLTVRPTFIPLPDLYRPTQPVTVSLFREGMASIRASVIPSTVSPTTFKAAAAKAILTPAKAGQTKSGPPKSGTSNPVLPPEIVLPPLAPSQAARAPAPVGPAVATPRPFAFVGPDGPMQSGPAEPGAVRSTLRSGIGCDDEKFLSMSPAEKERCAQNYGRMAKDAPHVRALDLRQKAYFDGDCDPPDDEWCLYRRGKGPYPGLLSLYKKMTH